MFDPIGKETPYLRRGRVCDPQIAPDGTPYTDVLAKKRDEIIIRVEYFLDHDPTNPDAYKRFMRRMSGFTSEDLSYWQTAALDSITFMELSARKYQQYKLNPTSKDPRQWFAGSTDQLEEMLMIRFGSLPINVVICAHVDEARDDAHGTFVRNPAAPGRMRKRLGAGYSEMYRAYAQRDEEGELEYLLQTRQDRLYNATSGIIQAPDPCPPIYEALWVGEEI